MVSDSVFALLKFGKQEHIEQFVHEGLIYMNSLSYFKAMENDMVRMDKHEGADYSIQADGAKLRMEVNGEKVYVGTVRGPIVSSNNDDSITNVFCMYAFPKSTLEKSIDPRNFAFGDTFVLLEDGDEFLRRVHAMAKKENMDLKQGLVEYVDKATYSGPMGIYRKFSNFEYQREFRFSVITGKKAPFCFRIGDITDISIVGQLSDEIEISFK